MSQCRLQFFLRTVSYGINFILNPLRGLPLFIKLPRYLCRGYFAHQPQNCYIGWSSSLVPMMYSNSAKIFLRVATGSL